MTPTFYSLEDETLPARSLASGSILTVFVFAAILLLINLGNNGRRTRPLVIGSHHPSPSHLLPLPTDAEPQPLTTEVKIPPAPEEKPLPAYFRVVRVLMALDIDRDGRISRAEADNAPEALRRLDHNRDGRLDAHECGEGSGDASAGRAFMRIHPVLAVLDGNGDGIISKEEISKASRALQALDENDDQILTLDELFPRSTAANGS